MNSTHKVEIVPLSMVKHDGADTLSVARAHDYTCVVKTTDWQGVKKAAYLPPDSLVDVRRPEFSFLAPRARADGKCRIKAMKIRGVLSFGLLVPVPDDAVEGEDWAEKLGVEHYDPDVEQERTGGGKLFLGGECTSAPNVYTVKYDVEAGRRYAKAVFEEGEEVVITEKCHGANSRYVYSGIMHCGSRTGWKKEYPDYSHVTMEYLEPKVGRERAQEVLSRLHGKKSKNNWWRVLDVLPGLKALCESNPDLVVYGELLGCQDLDYGLKKGDVGFVAFDMMKDGKWLDFDDAYGLARLFDVPWAPVLYRGPYSFEKACELAEGRTCMPNAAHVREGCVVRRAKEKEGHIRGALKWIGAGYLERSK